MAADWALAGHTVRLFDFEAYPAQIDAIRKQGGIEVSGQLNGFAAIDDAGHSVEKAIANAELIVAVGPAYSTEPFAQAVKPFIKPGQNVVVCPGSCGGALLFRKALGLTLADDTLVVGETSTLPYACRLLKPGTVHVYLKLKGGLFLSALPKGKAKVLFDQFRQVYKSVAIAGHYFQTVLQNANPVIHPAVMLLNAGRVENTQGDFYFYEQGVMPSVGRLIEAVDNERINIGKALGIEIIPDPEIGVQQGYMESADYETGYSAAPGFKGIKTPPSLDHRYLNEDVGFGLLFMTELAAKLGVETPVMNAIIRIASIVMQRDYRREGTRSLQSLGLADFTASALKDDL